MFPHLQLNVHVAGLSTKAVGVLTFDSQAGLIDQTRISPQSFAHAIHTFEGDSHMRDAVWNRIGPAAGLLFFPVIMVGFSIHGYPDIQPTDAQLAKWLAGVDHNAFKFGVYVEALGTVLFLPFAAWLFGRLRQDGRNSWPAVAMLAAGAGWATITLPINESWVGLVGRAGKGLDIGTAQTVVAINQAWFEMTGILFGLTLIAAGVAIIRGASMSRLAGWPAVVIGLGVVASVPLGAASTPAQILAFVWFLLVGGYYTVRPGPAREKVAGTAPRSVTTGLPATR
jgi:hypothetical protein